MKLEIKAKSKRNALFASDFVIMLNGRRIQGDIDFIYFYVSANDVVQWSLGVKKTGRSGLLGFFKRIKISLIRLKFWARRLIG